MSSVDFKKNTFTGGAAMIAHMTRHDGQAVDYRNKYIQPELSDRNYVVGDPFGNLRTSRDVMDWLRHRVEEIDKVIPPKRRVKDRVTIMTYTITAPEGLSEAQERRFFDIAYQELAEFSEGLDNVSPGFVHRDEIHDYIGTSGERATSRAHMHVAGIPYTPKKGVNGKAFETRARMKALNRAIDERCRRELGCRFMTGEKGLSGRSVEELQAASETRAKRQARARINADLSNKRQEIRNLSGEIGELERTRDALAESAQEAQERKLGLKHDVGLICEQIEGLADRYNALSGQIQRAEQRRNKAYAERDQALEERDRAHEEAQVISQEAEAMRREAHALVERARKDPRSLAHTMEINKLENERIHYQKRWERVIKRDPALANEIERQLHRTTPTHNRHR